MCTPMWPETKPHTTTSNWHVPERNFVNAKQCNCKGGVELNGKNASVWQCLNGQTMGKDTDEYDWLWFEKYNDTESLPVRLLFSRDNNHNAIPQLGDNALVNFSTIDVPGGAFRELHPIRTACETSGSMPYSELPNIEVEGVHYNDANNFESPIWTDKTYATGMLYSVSGLYSAMQISYDHSGKEPREVSQIKFSEPQNGIRYNHTRLTGSDAWEVNYTENHKQECAGGLKNVGIWHPNWTRRAGCRYKATIDKQTRGLNNTAEDILAMSCHFGGGRQMQAWNARNGRPHLFYETKATDLDLIDYIHWNPDASFDNSVFLKDENCIGEGTPEIVAPFCATCHGGQVGFD